jgi:UDP-N-acetylmuramoyl-tripeptide--D-alanyl-D-alanine ligase
VIPLTLAEVAAATAGKLTDDADPARPATGAVVADSREVGPGDLFVALPGERVDGHDFAAAALAAGAAAVLSTRPAGGPTIVVAHPLVALGRLARAVVDRLPGLTVIGVTGSSGKTSTKDLLAAVLARAGETVAPAGSYNNELGVPLTVLRCDAATRFLVVEMGARGPGHIGYLCRLVRPGVGVVLNVGSAHVGEFGGREAIAQAKGELVESLGAGGVAVLNVDDALVDAMSERTVARVIRFGRAERADVRAADVTLDAAARASFTLVTPEGTAPVQLRLHGEHHVANALATAAVGTALGLDAAGVAESLSAAEPVSRWRMEVRTRPDGAVVVNDAYNANPESVAAALRALAAMTPSGGRSWAVLGEMLELGDASAAEHHAVGEHAAKLGVDRVVAVGPGARPVAQGAGAAGAAVADADGALALVAPQLGPGDVVLVKASRSVGLDRLAAALLGAGPPDTAAGPPPPGEPPADTVRTDGASLR